MSEEQRWIEKPCKHPTKISACGIKVCMDCGAPLNAKAKALVQARVSE